jgi:hypothetical protein
MKLKTKILIASAATGALVIGGILLSTFIKRTDQPCSGSCGSCKGCAAAGTPEATYYVAKAETLRKRFREQQSLFMPELIKYYGTEGTNAILVETSDRFDASIPDIPYIGGDENIRTEDIEGAAMALAFYEVQKTHGRTAWEIGGMIYSSTEKALHKYPGFILKILGSKFFSKGYIASERDNAKRSGSGDYEFDWKTEFVEGDGEAFDYGCDHTECGIVKYMSEHGADELTPYLCELDYLYSDAFGEGLQRSSTLAAGGAVCDFRYKQGRKTK